MAFGSFLARRRAGLSGLGAIKPPLLLGYLACDHAMLGERLRALGLSAGLAVFLGLYAALALSLLAAAQLRSTWLRLALAAPFAAGALFVHGYEWATRSPFDYAAFETMIASRGDTGDALAQHGATLARAAGAALLLFAAIAWPPRRGLSWRWGVGLPAAAVVLLAALLYARGGEGSAALPAPFVPLAQSVILGVVTVTDPPTPREGVTIAPVGPKPDRDVVLIVDESIAARYLDIDGPAGVRSGLLEPPPGLAVHNFGVAASATNCSAGSNRTLRFGGTRETFLRAAKSWPSLWAYAHRAGLRTVYMDAQRSGGVLQNLADDQERGEIDDFVQLPGVPVVNRDQELARLIAERLGNGIREFIYVNKIGAHFPVADKFPEAKRRYGPVPSRGQGGGFADLAAAKSGFEGTAENWRLYRNAYRNTLEWNVGSFFDRLLPATVKAGGVLIYTSDHGQDLHERGNPGSSTHCTSDPRAEEGAVPLVVIDSAGAPGRDWAAAAAASHDGASHFRLFPTLLDLFGYAPGAVAPRYGPSLLARERDPLRFTYTYFATLGRKPAWRPIDPAALAEPPPGHAGNNSGTLY